MMKKVLAKSIALMGLVSGAVFSLSAQANDGVLVFQHDKAKLTCETEATCGDYTDTNPIKVYKKNGNEMRLYWKYNVPTGDPLGTSTAKTIGAACPTDKDETNLTAQWSLTNNRPVYAVATDCDGNIAEFSITYIFDKPDCPRGETDERLSKSDRLAEICF